MSYRNLEIWQLSRGVVIEIHNMTLTLPKFEMYEEGSQIRRSSKSLSQLLLKDMKDEITKVIMNDTLQYH